MRAVLCCTLFLCLSPLARAESVCHEFMQKATLGRNSSLRQILFSPEFKPSSLIEALIEEYPHLEDWYEAPLIRGGSVRNHAETYLQNVLSQTPLWTHRFAKTAGFKVFVAMVRLIAALQNIGVRPAHTSASAPEEISWQLIRQILVRLKANEARLRTAEFLIKNRVFNDAIHGRISPDRALKRSVQGARARRLNFHIYLRLQLLLNIAEESSYADADLSLFKCDRSRLLLSHPDFDEFMRISDVIDPMTD